MPEKPINFGARFAYLKAIEAHWPEVLESLRGTVFPLYRKCWESNRKRFVIKNLAQVSRASQLARPTGFRNVERALRRWGKSHGFRDAWMLDVALESMSSWVNDTNISTGTYFPESLITPQFTPKFGYWIPHHQTWPEFRRSGDETYRRELAKYRTEISTLWGDGQPKLGQHAVWTVLWQQGKSPGAIQLYQFRMSRQKVTLANIQLRMHAFAGSAGLTLRARRAGRAATM
jgi:hypothetical protein